MKTLIIAAIFSTLVSSANSAEPYMKRAMECFTTGNITCAVKGFSKGAKAGNSHAQYLLGVIYLNKLAPSPAPDSAYQMISRSAEKGLLEAQNEMARMFKEGDGVKKNSGQMVSWYVQAAKNGDVGAQLMAADAYAFGDASIVDLEGAYVWYTVAADYWKEMVAESQSMMAGQLSLEKRKRAEKRAVVILMNIKKNSHKVKGHN